MTPKPTEQQVQFLGQHHGADPDWQSFTRRLQHPSFVQAVLDDPNSDTKLRRYARAIHALKKGETLARVPSTTSGARYRIKELPTGRVGCTCNDWKFVRSVKGGDCKHVRVYKAMNKMSKQAMWAGFFEELEKLSVDTRTLLRLRKLPGVVRMRGSEGVQAAAMGGGMATNKALSMQKLRGLEGKARAVEGVLSRAPKAKGTFLERPIQKVQTRARKGIGELMDIVRTEARGAGKVGYHPRILNNTMSSLAGKPAKRMATRGATTGVVLSHELAERGVQARNMAPAAWTKRFGHMSPEVLMKEHNTLSKLTGPGAGEARSIMRGARNSRGESEHLRDLVTRTTGPRGAQFLEEGQKIPKAMRKHMLRRLRENPELHNPGMKWRARTKLRRMESSSKGLKGLADEAIRNARG